MRFLRNSIAAMLLTLAVSGLSFGEELYGFSNGLYRTNEQFSDDDYIREQQGSTFNIYFYYFPGNSFLGIFAQTSFGRIDTGIERNSREEMPIRNASVLDIRSAVVPSIKLQLGSKVRIPLSIGPVLSFYHEETNEHSGYTSAGKNYTYDALGLGIMGDISCVFTPGDSFFLRQGFGVDWQFLRAELGEMRMNYRTTHNSTFKGAPYSALTGTIYMGLGWLF
jgi:hypothetical protein